MSEEQLQEQLLQAQLEQEQQTEFLLEEINRQNYDFDYGDVKY